MVSIEMIIFFVGTFVVPAIVILADNEEFSSRNKREPEPPAAD